MDVGFAGALLGGMAALLSPCAALLLPAFFAYAFGSSKRALIGRTALFYLGLLITLVPLGLAAGALGGLLTTHRATVAAVGGVILIVFGVVTALGLQLPIPGVKQSGRDPRGALGVVILGATYGLAGACTGPLLGAVLTMAAVGGSPAYGAVLLAAFGLGMVVPLVVLALLWDRFKLGERFRAKPIRLGPFTTSWVGLLSGLLFVAVGVLFLTTDATSALGGILDAGRQFQLESWLAEVGRSVPDVAVLFAVLFVIAAVLGWRWIRGPKQQA